MTIMLDTNIIFFAARFPNGQTAEKMRHTNGYESTTMEYLYF
jgi:hypothetical protein